MKKKTETLKKTERKKEEKRNYITNKLKGKRK